MTLVAEATSPSRIATFEERYASLSTDAQERYIALRSDALEAVKRAGYKLCTYVYDVFSEKHKLSRELRSCGHHRSSLQMDLEEDEAQEQLKQLAGLLKSDPQFGIISTDVKIRYKCFRDDLEATVGIVSITIN
jgi:hypothetical protein